MINLYEIITVKKKTEKEEKKSMLTLNIYTYILCLIIYIIKIMYICACLCWHLYGTYATCVWFSMEVISLKLELQMIVSHLHGSWVI